MISWQEINNKLILKSTANDLKTLSALSIVLCHFAYEFFVYCIRTPNGIVTDSVSDVSCYDPQHL